MHHGLAPVVGKYRAEVLAPGLPIAFAIHVKFEKVSLARHGGDALATSA
jgi:hypothetical protein